MSAAASHGTGALLVAAALLTLGGAALARGPAAPGPRPDDSRPIELDSGQARSPVVVLPPARLPVESGASPIYWDPGWPRFSRAEWIITGLAGVATLSAVIAGPSRERALRGWGPDEEIRDALRLGTLHQRRVIRDVSDAFLTALNAYPFVVDALVVAAWYRRSSDVALQMALINAEAIAITLALQTMTNVVLGRERPYGRDCDGALPSDSRDCDSNGRHYSFFSGHTSQAFVAAALICSHHYHLELYGGGWADAVPCAAGFTAAAATGMMRIMGDMHYFSDVMVGAAVGTLVGLGVPWLFHYRFPRAERVERRSDFTYQLLPGPMGASMVGTF